ncbi:MAG: hypothetical protein AAGI10_14000, partial [Pseudomonadota bacterium]
MSEFLRAGASFVYVAHGARRLRGGGAVAPAGGRPCDAGRRDGALNFGWDGGFSAFASTFGRR